MIDVKMVVTGPIPAKATKGSSGYDLFWSPSGDREYLVISPGQRRLIPTGVYLQIPRGFEAQIRSRSGLALKSGVIVLNSPGTIDSDYRGEIGVILLNTSVESFYLEKGKAIAQLVFSPVEHSVQFEVLSDPKELSLTERGSGGFGSTTKGEPTV